ncbi:bZIP_1 domain-containing protein [Cephalotus follicularis]|uniref:BZIP_1 domain-containing protein n=1 Tax=Cephalotus follicularis TaxID=3775 RepID=A0A1Q3BDC0_CEPFO|nr:bZIP_1 domain-containing protein [Cephalotus follicularis]
MEDLGFVEDGELLGDIDWDKLLAEIPDEAFLVNEGEEHPLPPPVVSDSTSPDSLSSWIGEIEATLMEDDIIINDDIFSQQSSWIGELDTLLMSDNDDNKRVVAQSPADASSPGEVVDKESKSNLSEEPAGVVCVDVKDNDSEVADDPVSKKRRRQLRNRDAAVRSRERKKTYVRDLEMKSKYMEAECRRLGRLLQSCLAENQFLRVSLQNGNAFGASSAKQESAVLLLESLLLGSLLWFLGIMCLFILPILPQSDLEATVEKGQGSLAPKELGNKMFTSSVVQSLLSRRCKGSRTKMKTIMHAFGVLA